MSRIITVKGTGTVSSKPDTVVLTMDLDSRHAEYGKCMKLATKELETLRRAIAGCQFADDALKTTDFRIEAVYKSCKDSSGTWHDLFDVWCCSHELKLEFPLDCERLTRVLAALAKCDSHPKIKVKFRVADRDAICEALLRDAAQNARRKAEILCAASGVTLGELVTIDYNWGELSIFSRTNYENDCEGIIFGSCSEKGISIDPEEVKNSDTVTFVWNIV